MTDDRRPRLLLMAAALSVASLSACVLDGLGEDSPTPAYTYPPEEGGGAGLIDVRERGAAGDGIADDTEVLALALAEGVAGGATVFFPDGAYRVTRPIEVDLAGGGRLAITCGPSAGVVSELAEPDGDEEVGVFTIRGAGGGAVSVDGLAIYHHGGGRGQVDGLLVSRVGWAALSRVLVTGASRWGVALDQVAGGRVASSEMDDNRYGGLGLIASTDILVDGGSFSRNGTTAVADGYGVALASNAIGPSRGVTIRGVTADGNLRKGLDVHSGHDVVIEGSTVRGFGLAGIYAVNEDAGKDVADIVIRDNFVDGMEAAQPILGIDIGAYSAAAVPSGRFEVVNNVIRNTSSPASTAILVRNGQPGAAPTSSVLIHHNEIWNGAGPGAYAVRTDNDAVPIGSVTISNNYVHARSPLVLVGVLAAGGATLVDNQLVTESGTAVYGIIVAPPAGASITGNRLEGSYDTAIAAFSGQSASGNTLNGAPL
jgi:hypothetical protein